jgi:hypothetical protein
MPNARQTRRPTGSRNSSGAGVGVDFHGGPVIDPTENVLALVDAESKRQDQARLAETRRIDDLATMRDRYEGIIEGMRNNNLMLLAVQLKETKEDLSKRSSLLEQYRWETGGKSQGVGALAAIILSVVVAIAAIASVAVAILTR